MDFLPTELLDKIFASLSQPAPSASNLRNQPSFEITQSENTDLKSVSLVSSRWRQTVLPQLFRHARVILRVENRDPTSGWPAIYQDYLTFIETNELERAIESFTLLVEASPVPDQDDAVNYSDQMQNRWHDLLLIVNPKRLTIAALPPILGLLAALPVPMDSRQELHMPYCILSLGCSVSSRSPAPSPLNLAQPSTRTLLSCHPWDSLLLNEGSFLRAYTNTSYQSTNPPSLLSALALLPLPTTLTPTIRSLTYIAIFPFWEHVAQLHGFLAHLRRLEVQLLPRGDLQPDPWQSGMADTLVLQYHKDLAYSNLLRHMLDAPIGQAQCLEEIVCLDVAVDAAGWKEAVQTELAGITGDWKEDPDREGVFVQVRTRCPGD